MDEHDPREMEMEDSGLMDEEEANWYDPYGALDGTRLWKRNARYGILK